MTTHEALQAAVDEIREVCHRHGIVLIATCETEGIFGEILIAPVSDEDKIDWLHARGQLTNTVEEYIHYVSGNSHYYIEGIGVFPD